MSYVQNRCVGFSTLLKGDNVLFSSRKVERRIGTQWDQDAS